MVTTSVIVLYIWLDGRCASFLKLITTGWFGFWRIDLRWYNWDRHHFGSLLSWYVHLGWSEIHGILCWLGSTLAKTDRSFNRSSRCPRFPLHSSHRCSGIQISLFSPCFCVQITDSLESSNPSSFPWIHYQACLWPVRVTSADFLIKIFFSLLLSKRVLWGVIRVGFRSICGFCANILFLYF